MAAGDFQDRIDVARVAVEMHRHDRSGPGRDGALDELRVEVEGGVIDIHVNGFRADVGDGPAGGDKGKRRGDDFIAGADAEQEHGDVQGGGAAVEADAMFRTEVFGEVFFKLSHVGSEAEGAIVDGAGNGGSEVFAQAANL